MIELNTNNDELENYLKNRGWLEDSEDIVSTENPGDGNMNFTLRINTGERTFILKQSRDYVEKYPEVDAPSDRVLREAEFYAMTAQKPELDALTPDLMGLDEENSTIILEDLGDNADYSRIYQEGASISESELVKFMEFAAELHNSFSPESAQTVIRNRAMRTLNHEHMFVYPYVEDNGLNLDKILPGLEREAQKYKNDDTLKAEVKKIGERYLEDGDHLLHGDYFPGSWLKTETGIAIIDPEFCFFGPAEFEVGVTVAHLKMADQPETIIKTALESYRRNTGLNDALRQRFTATEILRRLLGLAQLPLETDLEHRCELLEEARETLL